MSQQYSLSFSPCLHPDPSVKKMTRPVMVLWKALNIGIKYTGDFTFYQDHVLLTDILLRDHPQLSQPFPLQPLLSYLLLLPSQDRGEVWGPE